MSQNARFGGENSSGIESALRDRVACAKREYERAIAEEQKPLRRGFPELEAGNRIQVATRRYAEALQDLSEFVLDDQEQKCS